MEKIECMNIIPVLENKKQYMDLLLIGDEQESMINQYLEKGEMYILHDEEIKAVCVVTDEGKGICELKNLAVYPKFQRKGYGKHLLRFLFEHYKNKFSVMQVGTGDSPLTIRFYESCGFCRSHCIPKFFITNYDHPIYEEGKQLVDMIYLRRDL